MSFQDHSGPAFPIESTNTPCAPGMTLRDWFAGHIAGHLIRRAVSAEDWLRIAEASYELANQMVTERGK